MNQLKAIQQAFQSSLQKKTNTVIKYIQVPDNMTRTDRLEVYHNDYFFRLSDSLKDDFEVTCQILGEEKFDSMVRSYLSTYPPTSYSLRNLGSRLSQFAKENSFDEKITELIEFEFNILESLFSENADVLSLDQLAKIDPDQWLSMSFHFHPSLRVINGAYNTLDVWMSYQDDKTITLNKLPQSVVYLIWRQDNYAYFRQLKERESELFAAISAGLPFCDVCEKMLGVLDESEVVEWVSQLMQEWINDKMFSNSSSQ